MITKYIHEHDDVYSVNIPEGHEIKCQCDTIIDKEDAFQCEICFTSFCRDCGVINYKDTGWFICLNCLENPDSIIDALLEFNNPSNKGGN